MGRYVTIPKISLDFRSFLLWRYTQSNLTETGYRRMWLSPFHLHSTGEWRECVEECAKLGLMEIHLARECRRRPQCVHRECVAKGCSQDTAYHVRFTRKGREAFRVWRVGVELAKAARRGTST